MASLRFLLVLPLGLVACAELPDPVEPSSPTRQDRPIVARVDPAPAEPQAAPQPQEMPAIEPPPGRGVGVNLDVRSIVVDGLKVEDLACQMAKVGLLSAMVVVGTLAKQKPAFAACGGKPGDHVKLTWTARGGHIVEASAASGDPKRDACYARSVRQVVSLDDGVCSSVLVIP